MNSEPNKNTERKNKIVAISVFLLSMVLFLGIALAYFTAPVSNTNKEKFSTETATIALEFDDNDNGVSGTLNLGESITKKFTLENTGTVDAYAKINWVDLVNTYLPGSLTYNLEQSTSENGTYVSIKTGNVPVSSSQTTETLKNGILVPVSTMYYYKLTITLNNLENVNQNPDINANFHSYFNLQEGSLSGAESIQNLVAGEPTNTTNVITKTAPNGASCTNTLAYDGTTDNNLRYVGANPCNYVTFNGETAGWRIVGIMNNVDDGTGNLETRIKLIRATSLGSYSWDTSDSSINSGHGINDWTQADLKTELNGDYLDTTLVANTNWYNGSSNQQTGVYDYTKGLTSSAQSLIGNAKWSLGGMQYTNEILITNTMYIKERSTEVVIPGITCNGMYCNDEITRSLDWTGKVALIYPSDYGYATAGGTVTSRNICVGTLSIIYDSSHSGETWMNNSYSDCKNNDWLTLLTGYSWLLSSSSYDARYVFGIDSIANVEIFNSYAFSDYAVFPAIYLKSDVSISRGNGTESEPFILG